jgi:hypothetical protein
MAAALDMTEATLKCFTIDEGSKEELLLPKCCDAEFGSTIANGEQQLLSTQQAAV